MNLIHALILGLVEGITEFLPISSTAHLVITSRLLNLAQTDFIKTFEIVIQLGAILAVVVLYAKILVRNKAIWKRIITAFVPTAVIGFVLYKIIKNYLLGNYSLLIWTIGIGGLILIACEYVYRNQSTSDDSERELSVMPYKTAFLIGLAQALAVVPGVSRSAATIVAGRVLGVSRRAIVEFSFLLAIPTMAAAAGYDLLKSAHTLSIEGNLTFLIVGFVTAFFSALIAVKLFLGLVKERSMIGFGVYRILLALSLIFLF